MPPVAFVLLHLIGSLTSADVIAAAPVFEQMSVERYQKLVQDGMDAYSRKDYSRAFPLVQRAACGGEKGSQALLGRMHVLGQGVSADSIVGYAWIKTAAEMPLAEYVDLAHRLEQAMAPDLRDAANKKAGQYLKVYGMTATQMSCTTRLQLGRHTTKTDACTPSDGNGLSVKIHRCVIDMERDAS